MAGLKQENNVQHSHPLHHESPVPYLQESLDVRIELNILSCPLFSRGGFVEAVCRTLTTQMPCVNQHIQILEQLVFCLVILWNPMSSHKVEKLVHSFQRALLVAGDNIVDQLHKRTSISLGHCTVQQKLHIH